MRMLLALTAMVFAVTCSATGPMVRIPIGTELMLEKPWVGEIKGKFRCGQYFLISSDQDTSGDIRVEFIGHSYQNTYLHASASWSNILVLVSPTIPIPTIRILPDQTRRKTDQWLVTLNENDAAEVKSCLPKPVKYDPRTI